MKWEDDPVRDEKYLILDAIIKFRGKFEGKKDDEITMQDLSDFIDEFIEWYFTYEK